MHKTNLRKVGGSIMLTVPPALLELLNLQPGAKVALAVRNGRLVVEPQPKPSYTLGELLAECGQKPGAAGKRTNGRTAVISALSSSNETRRDLAGRPRSDSWP